MKALFILCLFVFATIVTCLDSIKLMKNAEFNDPQKLQQKGERQYLCGQALSKMLIEACNSCSKGFNLSLRSKRAIVELKKETSGKGISEYCCKRGCTIEDLRAFCC